MSDFMAILILPFTRNHTFQCHCSTTQYDITILKSMAKSTVKDTHADHILLLSRKTWEKRNALFNQVCGVPEAVSVNTDHA